MAKKEKQAPQAENTFSNFADAYAALRESAEILRGMGTEDIDNLLPQVDRAMAAYAACRERLAAVRSLLEERTGGGEVPGPGAGALEQ